MAYDKEHMTIEEAEDIYMAAQVGANYPKELLPMAVLMLSKRDGEI